MAIWVSRYNNKELRNGKYYAVGISIGKPRWALGYELREQCYALAPKRYMLDMNLEDFKPAYYDKLAGIGREKIIDIVYRLEMAAEREGKELVLLCYEDVRIPEEWCHRTVFAEWWAANTGEQIKELPDPSEPKYKKQKVAEKKTENKNDNKKPEQEDDGMVQMSIFDMMASGI